MENQSMIEKGISRRGFMKGAAIGGAALTMSAKLALAEQMMTGRTPTIESIRGTGVEPGLVRMNLNENPIGPSPMAIKAIADNMFNISRYNFGPNRGGVVKALAEFDGVTLPEPERRQGGFSRGTPGPYLTTASSSQALGLLTLAYLSRNGGEVIEAEFGYGQISRSALFYKEMFGVDTNVVRAPMKDYKHDLDAMADAITPKTTMVVITNPNNPTGTLLTTEEIERFVDKIPERVIVVVDEAYIHFAEGDKLPSAIPLAVTRENVAVVRTFSKVYAMPALRLGYSVSSDKIKNEMMKYYTGGPNMLANVAGEATVKDWNHMVKSREVVWSFKKRLYEECEKMGWDYIPSQGTFVMVNLGRETRPIVQEMRKRKVMISNRRQSEFKNWIRVSAGTEPETEVFLQTLKEVVATAS